MRMRVVVVMGLVMALSEAPAGAGSSGARTGGTLADTFIDLVREAWKEDPGLVVLRARDRGYDLGQTVEAIGDGNLQADGTVTDEGRPLTPADPAAGVLAREGEAEVTEALRKNPNAISKPKAVTPSSEMLDNGTFMLVMLLALMSRGYTVEQVIVDGLLAEGIRAECPFCPVTIVDEKGKVVPPDDAADEPSEEDAMIDGLIRDMAAIAQGDDPLDPDFKPRFDVTYDAKLAIGEGTATVQAKGKLGVAPDPGSGDIYLGRLKGKIVVPGGKCPTETVSVAIGLSGIEADRGPTRLDQTWGYTGSTTGGGGTGKGLCITAAEAPELVGVLGPAFGPLSGKVAAGQVLESDSALGVATLTIKGAK